MYECKDFFLLGSATTPPPTMVALSRLAVFRASRVNFIRLLPLPVRSASEISGFFGILIGQPCIHLVKTDLQLIEKAHAQIIKTSLGLSKFSRTNPLITDSETGERGESLVFESVETLHVLVIDLLHCFTGPLYKSGDSEGETLMGRFGLRVRSLASIKLNKKVLENTPVSTTFNIELKTYCQRTKEKSVFEY